MHLALSVVFSIFLALQNLLDALKFSVEQISANSSHLEKTIKARKLIEYLLIDNSISTNSRQHGTVRYGTSGTSTAKPWRTWSRGTICTESICPSPSTNGWKKRRSRSLSIALTRPLRLLRAGSRREEGRRREVVVGAAHISSNNNNIVNRSIICSC